MTDSRVGRQIECDFAQRWEEKAKEVLPVNEKVLSKAGKQANRQTEKDSDIHTPVNPPGTYLT